MKKTIILTVISFCFLLAHHEGSHHGNSHSHPEGEVKENINANHHEGHKHSMEHKEHKHSHSGHNHSEDNHSGHSHSGHNHDENHPMSHIPVVAEELDRVGIEENIGSFIDQSLVFYNSKGEEVVLDDLVEDKPVILTFAYYSCPRICHFVLEAQKKAMDDLSLQLGSDYQAVTISFDERDKQEVTARIKSKYVSQANDESWHFLYGDIENIKAITSSLGFRFKWIEANQEFAHSAVIYVITPNGKISRYFYGLNYNPFELKLAVLEAKKENTKSTLEKVLLYCYRYDHEARGYVLHAWNLMKTGGVVTIFFMSTFLFVMFRREKKYIKKIGDKAN